MAWIEYPLSTSGTKTYDAMRPLCRPVGRLDLRLRQMCWVVIRPTAKSMRGALRMCSLSAQGSKGWLITAQGSEDSKKRFITKYVMPLAAVAMDEPYRNHRWNRVIVRLHRMGQ